MDLVLNFPGDGSVPNGQERSDVCDGSVPNGQERSDVCDGSVPNGARDGRSDAWAW